MLLRFIKHCVIGVSLMNTESKMEFMTGAFGASMSLRRSALSLQH